MTSAVGTGTARDEQRVTVAPRPTPATDRMAV